MPDILDTLFHLIATIFIGVMAISLVMTIMIPFVLLFGAVIGMTGIDGIFICLFLILAFVAGTTIMKFLS